MNDPHVVKLFYNVVPLKTPTTEVDYSKAKRLEYDNHADFTVQVEARVATFTMKTHFASVSDAKNVVQRFIDTWELDIGLKYQPGYVTFRYRTAEVIDRDPPEHRTYEYTMKGGVQLGGSADVKYYPGEFPSPPETIVSTPETERMFFRYGLFFAGKEPLLSMAYYCLTELEEKIEPRKPRKTGSSKRNRIGQELGIDPEVLNRVGELSSEYEDDEVGRKAGTKKKLSESERRWLKKAVMLLIRRLAEHERNPNGVFDQITIDYVEKSRNPAS